MAQQKVDYQKINSLKGKAFDVLRNIEQVKFEATKILEPYNTAIDNYQKELFELNKQIQEEESKIKK